MEHIGKKTTIFGSFVMDLMDRTPHLPVAGEAAEGIVFKMRPGGKEFNQGIVAYKTGADMTMMIKLGQDVFVDITLNTMNELHMDTGRVLYSETTETGCALVMMDKNSSQSEVVVTLGACDTVTDQEVDPLEDLVGQFEYLLTQLEANVSSMEHIVNIAYREGAKVTLNTASTQPVGDELLEKIDLITPNEVEAETPTGIRVSSEETADKATGWFFLKGVKNVLITLGQGGVCTNTGEKRGIVPAYRVDAVDTTGTGNASNGGLLAVLAEGKGLQETAGFANALTALSVQKIGTTPSIPIREGTDVFMTADHQIMDGWRKVLQRRNYQRTIIRVRAKRTATRRLQSVEL